MNTDQDDLIASRYRIGDQVPFEAGTATVVGWYSDGWLVKARPGHLACLPRPKPRLATYYGRSVNSLNAD